MMSDEAKANFYRATLWTKYVIAFLGIWLLAITFSFNYSSALLWWSDFLSGVALLASSIYALTGRNDFTPWDSSAIGLWLLVAPVLLWAPDMFVYLNDTGVGVLALAFGALISGVPEDALRQGDKTPSGWSYNPSSWMQRLPIIALAVFGWFFCVYMAAYQLGYRSDADFLFGRGTTKVLDSGLSGAFPMADGALSAVAFLLLAILACMGSARRWHALPWVVVLFGGVSILFGLSSAFYALLQPVVIGAWCGWCILAAVCALAIVTLAIDEVIAVVVYLVAAKRAGKPLGQVFWQGDGGIYKEGDVSKEVTYEEFSIKEMFRGIGKNWNVGVSFLIGIILVWTSYWFLMGETAVTAVHVIGGLILIVSMLAFAEVLSTLRYLNVLLGVVLIICIWLAAEVSMGTAIFYTLCGAVLIAVSLLRRRAQESYGTFDKIIF